jgi:hypothetical protein
MKLNGTRQLLGYAEDDVNILGGSVSAIMKNAERLVGASKETGLEVNDKYMVMSRYQNAGRSCNIKTDNKSFERAEQFKHLKKTPNESKFYSERR